MEITLLKDVIIIFSLSILVIFIFHRIKVPAIIGFLLTGILCGPHGLELVKATHEVEILAEIGVILLLFTIGIEFSIGNLLKIKKSVLVGGTLQVFLVIALTFLVLRVLSVNPATSVFTGFLVALSSTAIVLKIIQTNGEIGTFHGQTSLAILIFSRVIIRLSGNSPEVCARTGVISIMGTMMIS